jgi:hypothetical protein
MSLSTYSDLQTSAAGWLERDDLTDRIPDFVTLAEAQMNRSLRVRKMVARSTATLADEFSAVPTDYLQPIQFICTDGSTTWEIDPTPLESIAAYKAQSTQTGKPRFYAVVGGEFQFYPAPDASYDAALTYYQQIPALSDAEPSNWVLANHPDAYLYGTLLQAAPYLRDAEQTAVWGQLYTAALDAIRTAERTLAGKLRTEVAQMLPRTSFNMNTGL